MSNMVVPGQLALDQPRISPTRVRLLQRLGRPHSSAERMQAIAEALDGGMSLSEIEEILDWLDQ